MAQREMEIKVGKVPETVRALTLDPIYEDNWQPLDDAPPDQSLAVPRTWAVRRRAN